MRVATDRPGTLIRPIAFVLAAFWLSSAMGEGDKNAPTEVTGLQQSATAGPDMARFQEEAAKAERERQEKAAADQAEQAQPAQSNDDTQPQHHADDSAADSDSNGGG